MSLNLIIGCGGSGLTTMTALNKLLVQNPDILPRMCDDIYYLAVDTDLPALKKFEQDIKDQMGNYSMPFIQQIVLSDRVNILNEIVKPKFIDPFSRKSNDRGLERIRHNWWFDENGNPFNAPKVKNLKKGAGQCPPASYGLAWYRLDQIGEAIQRIVNRMIGRGNGDPEQLRNINLIVVSGLAGGTGRGCWSLITFKLREYLLNNYNITVPPIGIFFDANVFECIATKYPEQRLALELNSLTGISELSCWMKNGSTQNEDERFEYRLPNMDSPGRQETDVLKVDLEINPNSGAPVDSAYLICGKSQSAILNDNRQYHEMAGAAIYAMIANPEILQTAVNDGDPYNSLGACTFEVDALHIRSYFETRARSIALNNLSMTSDDVTSDVDNFLQAHPFNAVARIMDDLKPNTTGTLYQRVVMALLSEETNHSSFVTISEELKDWKQSDALENILPLLEVAKDDDIKSAVQKALKGFGKNGLDGRKGELAVVNAMKDAYKGKPGQKPSVGRALEFLRTLKTRIEVARGTAPDKIQMSTEATTTNKNAKEAVETTLKVFSKRSIKEVLHGVGAYNDDEIASLIKMDDNWGIIQQGVAAANYPKIKDTIAEAFDSTISKISQLINACDQFTECCRSASAALALEEPIAAGGKLGQDAFSLLFSTPDKIDETLYDASNLERFYHRILRPIEESSDELEKSVKESIIIGDGIVDFISQAVDNGTLEKLGSDSGVQKVFIEGLINATKSNVKLSDDFMMKHFTFEKILEKNRKYWNDAIAAAQLDGARKSELNRKFVITLGTAPIADIKNPQNPPLLPSVEALRITISTSIVSVCAPWWIAETTGARRSVMLFVPFASVNRNSLESDIQENAPHTNVSVKDLSIAMGGATPFSYVAFVSEGITLNENDLIQRKHLLDKITSLKYYSKADVNAWLHKAENNEGESIFTTENHNKGIGYPSPVFVKDKKLSSYRWKPWLKEDEALTASAENQVLDILLYALLGTGLTEEQATSFKEKLKPYGWSFPPVVFQENGENWLLVRKTFVWDKDERKASANYACPWKTKKICTSACNLLPMLKGKGNTGKNGICKPSDVELGNKINELLSTEKAVFEEYIAADLGADIRELKRARNNWLADMRDKADPEDRPLFDALLIRAEEN
ncbi:hypothetical protein J6U78_07540 [bacterium]|nr:hypothetical protein [bacterium]